MNTYECMYIIQANLSDDENDRSNRRIAEDIEKRDGAILDRERLGKKRLAYSIRKHDDGVYYLMYFELPAGQVTSLRAAFRMHPRLLRFLILRRDPEDVPKLQKRTPSPAEPEAAPVAPSGQEAPATAAAAEDAAEAAPEGPDGEPATGKPEVEPAPEEAPAGAGPDTEATKQE